MPNPITPEEHQRRLNLYRQGLSDSKMAKALGMSKGGIRTWRETYKLLPWRQRTDKNASRMEDALSPDECAAMRRFLRVLVTYAKKVPEWQNIDVGAFLSVWRQEYGGGRTARMLHGSRRKRASGE